MLMCSYGSFCQHPRVLLVSPELVNGQMVLFNWLSIYLSGHMLPCCHCYGRDNFLFMCPQSSQVGKVNLWTTDFFKGFCESFEIQELKLEKKIFSKIWSFCLESASSCETFEYVLKTMKSNFVFICKLDSYTFSIIHIFSVLHVLCNNVGEEAYSHLRHRVNVILQTLMLTKPQLLVNSPIKSLNDSVKSLKEWHSAHRLTPKSNIKAKDALTVILLWTLSQPSI